MRNINKVLAQPAYAASSRYGAQMGRPDRWGSPTALLVQRVRFVDMDYDAGGAYWGGGGNPLWAAFSADDSVEDATMVFVRATSSAQAIEKLRSMEPLNGFTYTPYSAIKSIVVPRIAENLSLLQVHYPKTLQAFADTDRIKLKTTEAARDRMSQLGIKWYPYS